MIGGVFLAVTDRHQLRLGAGVRLLHPTSCRRGWPDRWEADFLTHQHSGRAVRDNLTVQECGIMMWNGFRKTLHRRAARLVVGGLLASVPTGLLSAGLTAGAPAKPGAPAKQSPATASSSRAARPFRVEEATIADLHRAIQQGETTCQASSRPTSSAPGPTTAAARGWSRATARQRRRLVAVRARRIAHVAFRRPRPRSPGPAELRRVHRPADRLRTDGADQLGSEPCSSNTAWSSASERRPGQRAEHAQYSRRAFGHLQGEVRRAAVCRAAAGELPGGVRRRSASSRTRSSAPPSSTPNTAGSPT